VASGGTYSVVLHTTAGGSTTAALPTAGSGWVNTGDNIGLAAGNDGLANGVLSLGTISANVTNANFGIEQPPAPGSGSNAAVNPGGTTQVTVPANTFTNTTLSTDPAPGSVTAIRITAIPTGATTIVINGTTYGPGFTTFPAAGVDVPTDASGNPTQVITVDPTAVSGATTVTIVFRAVDAAGVVSTTTGNAVLNLTGVSVSGTIFNDADGLTDNTVNGTPVVGTDIDAITAGAQAVYVSLVQGTTIIATVPVSAAGTYTFADVTPGNYNVVLHTTSGGSNTPAITSAGNGWAFTGENLGTAAGNDGTVNGLLAITVTAGANVTDAHLAIEQLPLAGAGTQTSPNPGANTSVTVDPSAFTNTTASGDATPGTLTGIRITAIPTAATTITINGTTYGPGFTAFPVNGVDVPTDGSGNPTVPISVDPTAVGATSVTIPFKAIDNAGKISNNTGSAVITFNAVNISGTIFDDANGLTDNTVNGTPVSGTDIDPISAGSQTLYASLVQGGSVIATVPVTAAGTYTFANVATGNYDVVLHANPSGSTIPTLPVSGNGWNNMGEFIGTGIGNDGSVDGILSVSVAGASVVDANFGIEQSPAAFTTTGAAQPNPGGTVNAIIAPATFAGSDPDGSVAFIRVISFPTNTTTITINGVPYNSGNFPPAGVTVPATAAGQPTQAILVDPVNGAVTVEIPFVTIDNAGKESPTNGSANTPFTDLAISGTIYEDSNGGNIDGTATNQIGTNTLYANW